MKKEIFNDVDHFIDNLFAVQDDELKATEKLIAAENLPEISITPNQGKFLHILARLCNAQKILEIGTLGGYSTIWLARALPSDGKLITLELDPAHASVAQKNINRAELESIVDVRVGNALEVLPQIDMEGIAPFDMIFIDADKPPYPEYLKWALKLSRPGSLIIADNVVRNGDILDPASDDEKVVGVQQFIQMLAAEPSVTATIMQTIGAKGYDGMAIAVVN